MKVNYRHQLCAANFATLQLWRRRSLSGNCTLSLVEGGMTKSKVWTVWWQRWRKAANRISQRRTFLPLKTISSPRAWLSTPGLKTWESESGRKVKVKKSESEEKWKWKEQFLVTRTFSAASLSHPPISIYFSDAQKYKIKINHVFCGFQIFKKKLD